MNYTTIEQSKKLLELGLSPESADMCWCLAVKGEPQIVVNNGYNKYGDFEIPCWSVGTLLQILSNSIKVGSNDCILHIGKAGFKPWYIAYDFINVEESFQVYQGVLLESVYNMVVWLLENGYIKKEE